MLNVRLAGAYPVWEIAAHLTVAGDVFDGVFLCHVFSLRCLGWDLGLH